MIKAPRTPTQAERDAHEALHIPHEDWCEICVRGRGRNKPHRRHKKKRSGDPETEPDPTARRGDGEVEGEHEGDSSRIPRVSMDYFFLSDGAAQAAKKGGAHLPTNELRRRLRTAMLRADGPRQDLIARYDELVRDTLEEEGVSDLSDEEEDEERVNPAFVMVDEGTGNRYMRVVDQKGIGQNDEMAWLIKDVHE